MAANWLHIENKFINMDRVETVELEGTETNPLVTIYFFKSDSYESFDGKAAEKIVEYLNRIAYT